ncbi:hypothetical protein [Paenibacillus sp. RC84]|uniref:hypothetical protein n=1 Tax=Paenibacillus sp. RC84 TaxID=3156252 RepID=UPI003518A198
MSEARRRIEELRMLYRRMLHFQKPDGVWDCYIIEEIEELEKELTAEKQNMTAGQGDHVETRTNVWFITSITVFSPSDKEVAR